MSVRNFETTRDYYVLLGVELQKESIFYVYAPEWRENAAGIKVLHQFCHLINLTGGSAWLVTHSRKKQSDPHHDLITPRLNLFTYLNHRLRRSDVIVVYPETIDFNPIRGNKIIRYHLNYQGYLSNFEPKLTEFNLSYSKSISDQIELTPGSILFIPIIPKFLPSRRDKPNLSGLSAAYVGKYFDYFDNGLIEKLINDSKINLIFRNGEQKQTQKEAFAIIAQSSYLSVFENSSIILESLLIGTPVRLHKNEYFHELIAGEELGYDGCFENIENFDRACASIRNIPGNLAQIQANLPQRVSHLIEALRAYSGWTEIPYGRAIYLPLTLRRLRHRIGMIRASYKKFGLQKTLRLSRRTFDSWKSPS